MSEEPIQQVSSGMITLSGEKPPLRMAVQYAESGQIALTKAALSPSENRLRGAGFGAYAIEPALYKLKFNNAIPLQAASEEVADAGTPLATAPAWPSEDR